MDRRSQKQIMGVNTDQELRDGGDRLRWRALAHALQANDMN